jgi:hypothetical protein
VPARLIEELRLGHFLVVIVIVVVLNLIIVVVAVTVDVMLTVEFIPDIL